MEQLSAIPRWLDSLSLKSTMSKELSVVQRA